MRQLPRRQTTNLVHQSPYCGLYTVDCEEPVIRDGLGDQVVGVGAATAFGAATSAVVGGVGSWRLRRSRNST